MQVKKKRSDLKADAVKYFIQNPSQQATGFQELADHLHEGGGLTFGNEIDNIVRPLQGGDLVMLLMRTGHGKTTASLALARNTARRIVSGEIGDEKSIIVYVTLEQQSEQIELMLSGNKEFDSSQLIRGEVPPDKYGAWATKRANMPLWVIGQSRRWSHVRQPYLYLETIIEGINSIKYDLGWNPMLVYIDYLQKVRLADGTWHNMNSQVVEASRALKSMAMSLDVPVVFGSQAGKKVDAYADKIPTLGDSMWASEADHESDIVIAGMRPSRYWDPDLEPFITIRKKTYENNDGVMIFSVEKQRFAQGYGTIGMTFIPQTLEMGPIKTVDLNKTDNWKQDGLFQ